MRCSRQYVYKLVNQDNLIAYLDMLAFLKEVMQTYTRNSAVSP